MIYAAGADNENSANLALTEKANKIYIFEEGGIIDSIRVFEFNFRNRNVHRHWSVAFRIQLYIPGDGYRPATGVYGNDTPSWIFRNHRTCARTFDTSPQILTLQIYEIETWKLFGALDFDKLKN